MRFNIRDDIIDEIYKIVNWIFLPFNTVAKNEFSLIFDIKLKVNGIKAI